MSKASFFSLHGMTGKKSKMLGAEKMTTYSHYLPTQSGLENILNDGIIVVKQNHD
jgi:hypothetical protein